jgi:hypothetical protein
MRRHSPGPAGIPAPVVGGLDGELNKASVDPIFIPCLRDVGPAATPLSVEAFDALIKRDAARWAGLLKSCPMRRSSDG